MPFEGGAERKLNLFEAKEAYFAPDGVTRWHVRPRPGRVVPPRLPRVEQRRHLDQHPRRQRSQTNHHVRRPGQLPVVQPGRPAAHCPTSPRTAASRRARTSSCSNCRRRTSRSAHRSGSRLTTRTPCAGRGFRPTASGSSTSAGADHPVGRRRASGLTFPARKLAIDGDMRTTSRDTEQRHLHPRDARPSTPSRPTKSTRFW